MLGSERGRNLCEWYVATLDDLHDDYLGVLDRREHERSVAFRAEADRRRFVLGAVLLRCVAARHLDRSPESIDVDRTCLRCGRPHGKPNVGSGLHVSVTHSGDRVVVAATRCGPVGVDVEEVVPLDHVSLVRQVCTVEERPFVENAVDLLTYWTRKEAVLKATGEGLTRRPTDLVVSPPRDRPRLLRSTVPDLRCTMGTVEVGTSYVGAFAVVADGPLVVVGQPASDVLWHCDPASR